MNAPLKQSATPECDRYRANLDVFLDALPDNKSRRGFLDREYRRWEDIYNRFLVNPKILPFGATEFDISITLADIATRRIKYGPTS